MKHCETCGCETVKPKPAGCVCDPDEWFSSKIPPVCAEYDAMSCGLCDSCEHEQGCHSDAKPDQLTQEEGVSVTVTCTSDEFLRDPQPWLDAMHSGKNVIVEPVNGGARMWLSGKPLSEINLEADEFAPKTPNEIRDHYTDLLQHVAANAHRHPWYGPCDGLGRGGSCSECDRRCFTPDDETLAKLEENRRLVFAEIMQARAEDARNRLTAPQPHSSARRPRK